MTLDDKQLALAKDYKNSTHENLLFASSRGCELSDEFTRLEVQIATILFAFAGLFVGFFHGQSTSELSDAAILMLRLAFASSLFFLIASLLFGLLHIKRKEKFWGDVLGDRDARYRIWSEIIKSDGDFGEAHAFHVGVSRGHTGLNASPMWTWVLQTIFLGVAVAELFTLAMVFLFQ